MALSKIFLPTIFFNTQIEQKGVHLVFYGPKYQGIYTIANAGQSKISGINEAGSKKFDALTAMARQGHSAGNIDRCHAIEQAILRQLHDDNGMDGRTLDDSNRRKRQKVQTVPRRQDMGHDDFAEDTVVDAGNFVLDLDNLPGNNPGTSTAQASASRVDPDAETENEDE